MTSTEPLVRVMRGGIEECVHMGALVLVEGERVVLARGDPHRVVFYRSASKPLQALELVVSGAANAFDLTEAEIAIAAGSHDGDAAHVAAVRSILAKADIPESALKCGGHRSSNGEVAFAQRRDGVAISGIHSNCSGKHAGMLAAAKHRGEPLGTYLELQHPVQQAIVAHVALLSGLPRDRVLAGIDGCGAPALAIPLVGIARSLARFVRPVGLPEPIAEAAARISLAMRRHPEMVAGEGRFDTDLIRLGHGDLVAKAGAEGVHVTALVEKGAALAIKVDDGADRGYRTAVVEVLRRLSVLSDTDADELRARHAPAIQKNLAGRPVGRIELAF